jgi:hypothetical protein
VTLGMGWFPAGIGPAGYDPVVPPDGPRNVRPPAALRLDGLARDYVLDDDGFYAESHPVDQKVGLALLVSRGAIAAVPGIGNKLRTIRRVSVAVAETLTRQHINEALSDLIRGKSIDIESIVVDTAVAGRLLFSVAYKNLELDRDNERTFRAELAYA